MSYYRALDDPKTGSSVSAKPTETDPSVPEPTVCVSPGRVDRLRSRRVSSNTKEHKRILRKSKSQAVIALSSGEAEYYCLVSASCNALGEQSVLKDWGLWLPLHCWMDSNTELSIASRHGLGRVKHIDTVFLWTQDAVSSGRISLGKKPTADMLADMLTKPLDQARVRMLLERMNYHFADGKQHLALDV